MNHLYIIHYIFNQIIQIIDVEEGGECPGVPNKVVLPPSYQTIIQKYFQTQQNDLKFINNQMMKALPVFETLQSNIKKITPGDSDLVNPKSQQLIRFLRIMN